MSATAFVPVSVAARFSDSLVVRLDSLARRWGTFVRRPTNREPLYLPLPHLYDPSAWANAVLGPGWTVLGRKDCDTFDGPVPALLVNAPERQEDALPVLLSTFGKCDVSDQGSPLWEAMLRIEPTLSVLTGTVNGTWLLLGRSAMSWSR